VDRRGQPDLAERRKRLAQFRANNRTARRKLVISRNLVPTAGNRASVTGPVTSRQRVLVTNLR
jgi:hypothetical protein